MVLQKFSSRVVTTQGLRGQLLVIHCLLPVTAAGAALKGRREKDFPVLSSSQDLFWGLLSYSPLAVTSLPHSYCTWHDLWLMTYLQNLKKSFVPSLPMLSDFGRQVLCDPWFPAHRCDRGNPKLFLQYFTSWATRYLGSKPSNTPFPFSVQSLVSPPPFLW